MLHVEVTRFEITERNCKLVRLMRCSLPTCWNKLLIGDVRVFWDVTPYNLVHGTNVSEDPTFSFFRVKWERIKMEAAGSSKALIAIYQTPLRHIPEGSNLRSLSHFKMLVCLMYFRAVSLCSVLHSQVSVTGAF
jgi:hypothetical protein